MERRVSEIATFTGSTTVILDVQTWDLTRDKIRVFGFPGVEISSPFMCRCYYRKS